MTVKKIVVLGLFGVGKTSLLKKFVDGTFSEEYQVTIGVHILKKELTVNDQMIKLILWDTEGTEHIQSMSQTNFKGTHGFIYMCDVTRPASYKSVENDVEFLKTTYPKSPVVVAANKSDLLEPGSILAHKKKLGFVDVMVSAKEGSNVQRLFEKIAKMTLHIS
jgi:small GTP-binding protein